MMKSRILDRKRAIDLVAAAAFLAVYGVVRYGAGLNETEVRWWNDLFWTTAALLAGIRCLRVARTVGGESRAAWLLFGLAHLSFSAGMLVWSFYEVALGRLNPFPSPADLGFLAPTPLFSFGIIFASSSSKYLGFGRFTASNLLIIAAGLLLIVPIWLLDALWATQANWLYMAVALSWAVSYSTVFVQGCVTLWTNDWGAQTRTFRLIVASLATHALASVLYTEALLRNDYNVGSWFDALWLIAFALFWWAAGERERMPQEALEDESSDGDLERAGVVDSLLAAAMIAGTFIAISSSTATPQHLDALLMILGTAFSIGIAWRGWEFYRARERVLAQREALMARLRELGAAAKAASEAKSDFLAAMSHEIRTPLTGVLGMTDLLVAEDLTRQQRNYVDAIRASGRHLLSIINDILDFSRIETGKLELERIDFSLPELLERLRSLVHPQAVERGLELRFELSEHSPPVLKGDPTRLRQVLLNLVGNAIKFTHEGSVTLHASHKPLAERWLRFRFEVRDTGIGIAPEKQAELFTAFTQADRSTARRFGGSGLGLAISKRLVEAMGGEIGITSLPGVGSVFWFEVPFELGDPANLTEAASAHFTPTQPRRILVAEDVAINRDLLKDVLVRQGHTVVFAQNGAEAVAWAEAEPFDLILMDVQMPIMDGIEATRRIRKLDGSVRGIPILALTANVMAAEREKYLAAGMNECLLKPIDWNQLTAAIARCGGSDQVAAASEHPVNDRVDQVLLVDRQILDRFTPYMSGEQLASWLRRGIEDAEKSCEQMASLLQDTEELTRRAHSLKGLAGTFGFARISQIAAEIEANTPAAGGIEHLLPQLKDIIGATRAELRQLGLIGK